MWLEMFPDNERLHKIDHSPSHTPDNRYRGLCGIDTQLGILNQNFPKSSYLAHIMAYRGVL